MQFKKKYWGILRLFHKFNNHWKIPFDVFSDTVEDAFIFLAFVYICRIVNNLSNLLLGLYFSSYYFSLSRAWKYSFFQYFASLPPIHNPFLPLSLKILSALWMLGGLEQSRHFQVMVPFTLWFTLQLLPAVRVRVMADWSSGIVVDRYEKSLYNTVWVVTGMYPFKREGCTG